MFDKFRRTRLKSHVPPPKSKTATLGYSFPYPRVAPYSFNYMTAYSMTAIGSFMNNIYSDTLFGMISKNTLIINPFNLSSRLTSELAGAKNTILYRSGILWVGSRFSMACLNKRPRRYHQWKPSSSYRSSPTSSLCSSILRSSIHQRYIPCLYALWWTVGIPLEQVALRSKISTKLYFPQTCRDIALWKCGVWSAPSRSGFLLHLEPRYWSRLPYSY